VVLRHDNADLRLTPIGRTIGLVDDAAWESFERRRAALHEAIERAERTKVADALRRPELEFADVAARFEPPLEPHIGERVAIEIKCAGYVRRQQLAIEKAAKNERVTIPPEFDYAGIAALSREAREKLVAAQPRTLGAAGRIPGVTPSDLAIVSIFVHRATAPATVAARV
jgi:tRNA uridine 5-carboxymethylaminomethyl modification enzyme